MTEAGLGCNETAHMMHVSLAMIGARSGPKTNRKENFKRTFVIARKIRYIVLSKDEQIFSNPLTL
jgi:hypothetical protein